jgi:excisionase family DNA binding protein
MPTKSESESMPESKPLGASQAAAFLGIDGQTVRRLAKKRQVPCFKAGTNRRFHKEASSAERRNP